MARTAVTARGARPGRLVVVAGTATEVGKTWVACALAARLRSAGAHVAVRKPAQSYDPAGGVPTDAELLAAATGEPPGLVCAAERTYPVAMAPPMAAEVLGRRPPSLQELVASVSWPAGTDVGIVETAGGARSPLAADGDGVDLAALLAPDLVVLVADPGLGVLNAVRSAVLDLARWPLAVFLNRYDPRDDLHARNRRWLAERDGLAVIVELDDLLRLTAPAPPARAGRAGAARAADAQ